MTGGVFVVPLLWDRPPLRANDRRSWQAQARAFRTAKDSAIVAFRAAYVPKLGRAEVTLHYRLKDRRRQDADGIAPTIKAVLDAAVHVGVLADDDWAHVPAATCRIHPPTSAGPAMWLELVGLPALKGGAQ